MSEKAEGAAEAAGKVAGWCFVLLVRVVPLILIGWIAWKVRKL